MTDIERDEIFFRNKKGRYAPGGPYEHATRPMEGGSAGARGAVQVPAIPSRPLGMNWVDNRAQLPGNVEPIEKVDAVGYAQITMTRDPFVNGYKDAALDDTPVMSAPIQAPEDVLYTPAGMIFID